MKTCKQCKLSKEDNQFAINTRICKDCSGIRCALLSLNFSYENYIKLYEIQDYKCKICGIHENDITHKDKTLYLDHNHVTNYVRGLLCPNCNAGLGAAKDSIETLNKMIDYLSKFQD